MVAVLFSFFTIKTCCLQVTIGIWADPDIGIRRGDCKFVNSLNRFLICYFFAFFVIVSEFFSRDTSHESGLFIGDKPELCLFEEFLSTHYLDYTHSRDSCNKTIAISFLATFDRKSSKDSFYRVLLLDKRTKNHRQSLRVLKIFPRLLKTPDFAFQFSPQCGTLTRQIFLTHARIDEENVCP